jgi:hypothetical protein
MWVLHGDLGNGEWNEVHLDTEAEARAWWNTWTTVQVSPDQYRVMTLLNPAGEVVATNSNQ